MTREEMVKRRWKPYEVILYQSKGMELPAECILLAIDFDAEILTLTPMNDFYEHRDFPAAIQFCSLPKMKAAAIDGKKVKDNNGDFVKYKKIGMGSYFEDDDDDSNKAS